MDTAANGDYITILAEEDGVAIIGLTSGKDTRFHHTEKLDKVRFLSHSLLKTHLP